MFHEQFLIKVDLRRKNYFYIRVIVMCGIDYFFIMFFFYGDCGATD